MDEGQQALAELAEHIVGKKLSSFFTVGDDPIGQDVGRLPKDWISVAQNAGVYREALAEKTPKGKATWLGMFLARKVCRRVEICLREGTATASLVRIEGRGKQNRYFFRITSPEAAPDRQEEAAPPETAPSRMPTAATQTSLPGDIAGSNDEEHVPAPHEGSPPLEETLIGDRGNDLDWV
jgi:hypothetical protein